MAKFVTISDRGRRCGQTHPKARLTDAQVDQIRDLHEHHGLGYRRIAGALSVSWHTVRSICTYESRACTVADVRRLMA